jgi:hypothetical protein
MTPKQTLVAHIREMHRRRPANPESMTLLNLKAWHSGQHFRYSPGHYHEGTNTGPTERPAGWYTGEGAVEVTR